MRGKKIYLNTLYLSAGGMKWCQSLDLVWRVDVIRKSGRVTAILWCKALWKTDLLPILFLFWRVGQLRVRKYKTGSPALDCFHLINLTFTVWVPYG